ncbi:hypothetical protein BH09ACT7_BH09ACT7_38920 [soil metagenome]
MTVTLPHPGADESASEKGGRVCQAGSPSGGMLCGHSSDDLVGAPTGHRPQHPFTDDRICNPDHPSCHQGAGGGENLGRRLGVEPFDQCREPGRIQMMHGGSGRGQLYGVASVGGEVEVSPRHDVVAGAGRQSWQAESSKHSTEPDLDTNQFESVVGSSRERDIGDSREPLTHDVHDLGVEDVPHQQNFVSTQIGTGGGGCEGGRVLIVAQYHARVLEDLEGRPRHEQVRALSAAYEDTLHQLWSRLRVEVDGEVGDATDNATVGSEHFLPRLLSQ